MALLPLDPLDLVLKGRVSLLCRLFWDGGPSRQHVPELAYISVVAGAPIKQVPYVTLHKHQCWALSWGGSV